MNFSTIRSIAIPEGNVMEIITSSNLTIWKSRGNSRIPYIYQEVEWIQADTGVEAYLDLGFTFDTEAIVEIEYVESSTNKGRYIFGAAENSGVLRCMITETSGTQGSIGYGSNASSTFLEMGLNKIEFLDNEFNHYRLELKNGAAKFTNVSINYSASNTAQKTYTMTSNLYLFAQSYNGTTRFGNGYARIKSFKYYNKDNVLICDLVPCVRKSDNEIGMYDVARDIFLTNAGTGIFTQGNPVTSNGEEEIVEGYQEVEWICSLSGVSSYIDLGFTFDTAARIEMSQYISSDTNTYIFGAAENSGVLRCMLSAPYDLNLAIYGSNISSFISAQNVTYLTGLNEYEMVFNEGILQITNKTNGETGKVTAQKTYTMTNNLYLLGQNYNGSPRFGGERKVGYFKYYDKNNILICDLVPCYDRKSGEIGMYDKVRNIFLTNAGSGSFTRGLDVESTINSN